MEYIIISIIGIIVWAAILESLIASGSKAKAIATQLKFQTNLLIKIAEKHGVTQEEIDVAVDKNITPVEKKGRFW